MSSDCQAGLSFHPTPMLFHWLLRQEVLPEGPLCFQFGQTNSSALGPVRASLGKEWGQSFGEVTGL